MAGFRNSIIHSLSSTIGILPHPLLRRLSGQRLILPFYHSISNRPLPHIQHLYEVKKKATFVKDLDFLLKHYEPIDLQKFESIQAGETSLSKPAFLLTFDDGLREFHDIIAPILLQKGIPAICFLNSGFIDNKDLFFRYKASLLIDHLKKNPSVRSQAKFFSNNPQQLFADILSVKYDHKEQLDELANQLEYSFDEYLLKEKPYLDSEQINSLIKKGFDFGAHSIDHPEYQFINLEEQIRQTTSSINSIQKQFLLKKKLFSFPFTDYNVSKKYFSEINKQNILDLSFGCAGQKKDEAKNHFQRIPLEMANLTARQILNGELFYYLLKMPLGKNKITRHD